jgi:hypothetical protein
MIGQDKVLNSNHLHLLDTKEKFRAPDIDCFLLFSKDELLYVRKNKIELVLERLENDDGYISWISILTLTNKLFVSWQAFFTHGKLILSHPKHFKSSHAKISHPKQIFSRD